MVENSSKPWTSEEEDQLRDILTLARLGRRRGLSRWGEGQMSNRRKWSPEDDKRLLELRAAGAPVDKIANELQRTQSAVGSRLNALKITTRA
jgi:hypothetical protein